MIIRNGESIYRKDTSSNVERFSNVDKFTGFKYGLSTSSNPNIIVDSHGEIIQVMIYISKTEYECLQGQGFSNATEVSKTSVIVNVAPRLLERIYENPKAFWEEFVGGKE